MIQKSNYHTVSWWLGSFYYIYAIARYSNSLITVIGLVDNLNSTSRGFAYYLTRDIGRIIIHSFILIYFFRDNVVSYFSLENYSKKKAIGILVGITLGLGIGVSLISLI